MYAAVTPHHTSGRVVVHTRRSHVVTPAPDAVEPRLLHRLWEVQPTESGRTHFAREQFMSAI